MLQPGDSAFYCSSVRDAAYLDAFLAVVRALRLRPVSWEGADRSLRQSNQAAEIAKDFYDAKVVVVRLSGDHQGDNWGVEEIAHAKSQALLYSVGPCLIQGLTDQAIVVASPEEFESSLRSELAKLLP